MVNKVQTVSGPISVESLGFVQPHEHVFLDLFITSLNAANALTSDFIAVRELRELREVGVNTIVDQTVHGLTPRPLELRRMSEETGVQIVAGTGFYWERYHPAWLHELSEAQIADLLIRELTTGIDGTDVRAGIIGEIGTTHLGITACEERVLRAAAAAQRELHVPIATHALFLRTGLDQVRILEKAGADLAQVVIGHVDSNPDPKYARDLFSAGVWVAFDTVGQEVLQSDRARAETVRDLVREGFGDHLLLSCDVGKRTALRLGGGQGYRHLVANFLPLLRSFGLDDSSIDQITRANPRRLFSGEALL